MVFIIRQIFWAKTVSGQTKRSQTLYKAADVPRFPGLSLLRIIARKTELLFSTLRIDMTKDIRECENTTASEASLKLARDIVAFQEKSFSEMKRFL